MANPVREARQQRRLNRQNHRAYRRAVRHGRFQPVQLADYDISFLPQVEPVVLEELPIMHYDKSGRPTGAWTRESEFTEPPHEVQLAMRPDDFAFGDVFNFYRKHLQNPGPDQTFTYKGKKYTTETREEKEAREAAARAKKEQEEKDAMRLVGRYSRENYLFLPETPESNISEKDIYNYSYPEYFAGNDSIPADTIIGNIPTDSILSELGRRIYNVTDSASFAAADSAYSGNDSLNYATIIPYLQVLPDTIWFNDSVGIPKEELLKDTAGINKAINPKKLIRVLQRRHGGKFPVFRNGGRIN